jgi:uncharacterized RDD family membrane protein YckC
MSVHPADPSAEDGSPKDAGPQDDSLSDTPASDPDATLETEASELPFGADQPGFTDWRVELRERLKKIRARRESEQDETDAVAEALSGEAIDESEVPTLDDVSLDTGGTEETPQEGAIPELDKTFEQSGEDHVVELSEVLGGADLPLQTDAVDEADDTVELAEQVEGAGLEDPVADLDELLEDEQPAETDAELLDEMMIEEADIDSSAAATGEEAAAAVAGAAAASGKAAIGWDGDVIANLQAGSAEAPDVDAVVEALDPLAGMDLSSTEPPQPPSDEAEEEPSADEFDTEDIAQQQIGAVQIGAVEIDADELVAAEEEEAAQPLAEEDVEEAVLEEVAAEEVAEEAVEADEVVEPVPTVAAETDEVEEAFEVVAEPAAEDFALDEILAEAYEAPLAGSGEDAAPVAAEDVAEPFDDEAEHFDDEAEPEFAGAEPADTEAVETEAVETDAGMLEFDDVDGAVAEVAPDLELDIEEIPASEYDAGLEWDTPAPPELMRPSTSGLDRSAAPLGQRAIAGIADALVLVVIAGVLVGAASSATGAAYDVLLTDALLPFALAWGIFAFGYSVFFTGTCGQTIGKMLMKLRVVSTDQLSVGFGRAAKRLVASVPSILVLGIGFFLALRDPKRRTVYDRIAQTRVVKA